MPPDAPTTAQDAQTALARYQEAKRARNTEQNAAECQRLWEEYCDAAKREITAKSQAQARENR